MLNAYKFRTYPDLLQENLIAKHFGCDRFIWNYFVALQKSLFLTTGKSISGYACSALIPGLKKEKETAWLSEVSSSSLQAVSQRFGKSLVKAFRRKAGFPKFRKKSYAESYSVPACRVNWETGTIDLPKIPGVRAILHRKFTEKPRSTTVSRNASGQYFISILVEDGKPYPNAKLTDPSKAIGVDLGLIDAITLSNGTKFANPRLLRKAETRLKWHARKHSSKKLGSHKREKARKRLAVAHRNLTNKRKDHLHKISAKLTNGENQAIFMESLNVQGMQKNHKLAKSIGDAGWGTFVGMVAYKSRWRGIVFHQIDRWEPTSKLCTCGVKNQYLALNHRSWVCGACGARHDRDILAANNILRAGLKELSVGRDPSEFTPGESLEYQGATVNREFAVGVERIA